MEHSEPGEPLTDLDPHRIGPYRLTRRLGGGGMGMVYLGEAASSRRVAVKVVHPHVTLDDPHFRERFAREIRACRLVDGYFTARVRDADPDAPLPWMATEFIPGDNLARRVAATGPLPPAAVLDLLAGVTEALVAIHTAGLVHRDLKPSNVILAHDGPRVIDFGIALTSGATPLTQRGLVIGTAGYMSPEQELNHPITPASDVFSMAAVMHFAATGRPPFSAGYPSAAVQLSAHGPVQLPDLPDETLRRLLEPCLAMDPALRPTPHAVLEQVTAYRADLLAQAPATLRRVDADPGRNARDTVPAATVPPGAGAAALPFTDVAPALSTAPRTGPGNEPDSPLSRRRVAVAAVAVAALLGVCGGAAATILLDGPGASAAATRSIPVETGAVTAAPSTTSMTSTTQPPASTSTTSSTSSGPATAPPAVGEAALPCSKASHTNVPVTFLNRTAGPVRVDWVRFDCSRIEWLTLQPGKSLTVTTVVGHAWAYIDESGPKDKVIGSYVATGGTRNATIF